MPLIAKYSFNTSLTQDQTWSYNLTQNNSPTNPTSIINKSLSISYSGWDDPGWTSEWPTSHYMVYSSNDMWINNTWSYTFFCLVKINTAPASGRRYCFLSKQVPWTTNLILNENNSWTLRLRFIRNRDYVWTDDTNFNVTLTPWIIYSVCMTYDWWTLRWYLNGVLITSRSSSWVWTTTSYTWLRIWQTWNNFGWSWASQDVDEVHVYNETLWVARNKNLHLYYKWFI